MNPHTLYGLRRKRDPFGGAVKHLGTIGSDCKVFTAAMKKTQIWSLHMNFEFLPVVSLIRCVSSLEYWVTNSFLLQRSTKYLDALIVSASCYDTLPDQLDVICCLVTQRAFAKSSQSLLELSQTASAYDHSIAQLSFQRAVKAQPSIG